MISSVVRDKSSVNDKVSHVVIKLLKGDKNKSVGMANLNLANYLESQDEDKVI